MNYESAQEMCDALSVPFMATDVDWRIGSMTKDQSKALPLAYIDARTVMERLDQVCGPDNWQCNYNPGPSLLVCNLGLRMPSGEWVWKADGAGATDVEGEKGMLSDALKRAAVRWGIGRYLYELKSGWIPIEDKKIPPAELKKLHELHEDFAEKFGWGDRQGVYIYRILDRAIDQFCHSAADALEFRENNKGMIPQLPVRMRKRLNEKLDHIGAAA